MKFKKMTKLDIVLNILRALILIVIFLYYSEIIKFFYNFTQIGGK